MSCPHEIRFSGLCGVCGEPIPSTPSWLNTDTDQTVHILHGSLDLQVSQAEAERVETMVMSRLLSAKRLSLVIDLDQTLLHATMDGQVAEWMADVEHPFHGYCKDVHRIDLDIDAHGGSRWYQSGNGKQSYFVKLRPKIEEFLHSANQLFELHVYTMGSRQYARACCKIIDPTGILFHDRILSRDDAGLKGHDAANKKSLKRIFPHSSTMVLVLDDRGDVWRWAGNVVLIRPFLFFTDGNDRGTEQRGYAAAAPRADAVVESALLDDELMRAWNRLSFMHSEFFASDGADIAVICDRLRRSVLNKIQIIFTGVFPIVEDADSKPDIQCLAESFGAVIVSKVEEAQVVIVGREGTDKHRRACELGIPTVCVDWLLQSCWSWRLLDFPDFITANNFTDDNIDSDDQLSSSSSELIMENSAKKHRHDETDLLDWLDNELDQSELSGDSDDIYGHSDKEGA